MGYKSLGFHYSTLLALAREGNELIYETAWCLVGKVKDGKVSVDGVAAPMVYERTTTSAFFHGCDEVDGLVGWFHNHPPQSYDVCQPSQEDIIVLESNSKYHILVLTCDGGTFVYRYRGDPTIRRIEHNEYLPPGVMPQ